MLRKYTLLCASVLSVLCVPHPARAGEIGIIPFPKDFHALTIPNFLEAVTLAKQAGSTIVLTAPKWSEMEPSKSKFTMDHPLGGSKYALEQGMDKGNYLGIQLINTVKREVPADLEKTDWDDPMMIARFENLVAAIAAENMPVKAISIGNEVDIYFEQHPQELDAYVHFLNSARPVLRKYFPNVRVGTTVTFEGLKKGRAEMISRLVDASDIIYFTYYPVIDLKPLPVSDAPEHLEMMTKAARGKQVVLQEINYPASEYLGSGNEEQSEFFEIVLPYLQKSEQIEASFIFALHDFSPPTCDMLIGYYGATAWPEEYQRGFREFICTLGLRYSDGKPRPSYDTVRKILIGHQETTP